MDPLGGVNVFTPLLITTVNYGTVVVYVSYEVIRAILRAIKY